MNRVVHCRYTLRFPKAVGMLALGTVVKPSAGASCGNHTKRGPDVCRVATQGLLLLKALAPQLRWKFQVQKKKEGIEGGGRGCSGSGLHGAGTCRHGPEQVHASLEMPCGAGRR